MTDRISKDQLCEFVDHGVYLMASHPAQKAICALAAEVIRLREALEPFAEAADGRKSKNISGSHCFGQAHLLKARAARNHKETE